MRIAARKGQIGGTRLVILVQHLLPGLPAIAGAKDSALFVRAERVPDRGNENNVRIVRVDQNLRDVMRIFESNVSPRLSGVDRFVHAIPIRYIASQTWLASTDVNDIRIR